MNFQELINRILDSSIFQEGMALLQTVVMVVITYLLNRAKAKIAEIKSAANNITEQYNKNLEAIKNKQQETDELLKETTETLEQYKNKLEQSNKDNKALIKILGLFTLDSKSIAANTKLAISKLLGQMTDQEQVEEIKEVVEESNQIESLTLEQVEEIKKEAEANIQDSEQAVESITQQTLQLYNEINNV